jgi:hypothetical protein
LHEVTYSEVRHIFVSSLTGKVTYSYKYVLDFASIVIKLLNIIQMKLTEVERNIVFNMYDLSPTNLSTHGAIFKMTRHIKFVKKSAFLFLFIYLFFLEPDDLLQR